jgi:hypothetical protein
MMTSHGGTNDCTFILKRREISCASSTEQLKECAMAFIVVLLFLALKVSCAPSIPLCVGVVYTSITDTLPLDVFHLGSSDTLFNAKAPNSTSIGAFAVGQRNCCYRTNDGDVQCYDMPDGTFIQLNTSFVDTADPLAGEKFGLSAFAVTDNGTVCCASLELATLRVQCLKPSGQLSGPFLYNVSTINPTSISLESSDDQLVLLVNGLFNSSVWLSETGSCVKFDLWSGTLFTSTFFDGYMYHLTDTSILKCRGTVYFFLLLILQKIVRKSRT